MIEKTYNVGIYCRLSNDDERDGESVSIENQKLLLQGYVRQRGWNEIAVYCDDGFSGTNFDRPGVKRLIEDAKAKKINLAALQSEYEALQAQKEALYADYGKLKKKVREYDIIKQNIDSILQADRQPEREKETERG